MTAPRTGWGALAQGLAGYQANRLASDERDYRREQDRLDRERQKEQDRIQREQMALVAENMRSLMADRVADRARQTGLDRRALFEGGYRPTEQTRQMGTALRSGEGVADQTGLMGAVGSALARYGTEAQRATPQTTMGGIGYTRSAESDQDRRDRMALAARTAERAADRADRKTERDEDRAWNTSERAKDRAAQRDLLNTRLNTPNPGTPRSLMPTEGERRAAAMLSVAEPALGVLESLLVTTDAQGKTTRRGAPSLLDRARGQVGMGVGNVLTSDQYRQVRQASNQLADMWLRFTSGAAVPEKEVERFATTFTPQPGDDDATLQQKEQARQQIIAALRTGGGRAVPNAGSRPPLDQGWNR